MTLLRERWPKKKVRVIPAPLADIARADEELVACDLGVGGSFAQSGEKSADNDAYGSSPVGSRIFYCKGGQDRGGEGSHIDGGATPTEPGAAEALFPKFRASPNDSDIRRKCGSTPATYPA